VKEAALGSRPWLSGDRR